MKLGKKITAFIIALVLTVYGLPVFPAAQASSEDQVTIDALALFSEEAEEAVQLDEPENIPESAIRFVQKVQYNEDGTVKQDEDGNLLNGFDSETGILTMCLQVNPDMLMDVDGGKLMEGVFLFQTDLNTLIPVTRPTDPDASRQQILGTDKVTRGAVVTSSINPEIKSLLATGSFQQITGSFSDLMSPDLSFNSDHTGLLVAKDTADTSLLDCYFQFQIAGNSPAAGSDGYVTVMEFDFQCYAGSDPAKSTEALFQGSIRLPAADDVERICEIFSYETSGAEEPTAVTMQSGAAMLLYSMEESSKINQACYYGTEPVLSMWRKTVENYDYATNTTIFTEKSQDTLWPEGVKLSPLTGDNSDWLWYENMWVKYVVTGFSVNWENTFVKEGETTGDDGSFTIPTSENYEYPRYVIPTLDRATANDQEGSWVPDAYLGTENNPVQLKYYVGTELQAGSVSSPEHESIEGMMQRISWEFLLDGKTPLEDCATEAEPVSTQQVQIRDTDQTVKTWTAKTFLINDSSLDAKYQGKKLWKMYDEEGVYRMTCPVGVVLEMLPTEIWYYDKYEGEKTRTTTMVLAPQLHVTNDAADLESAIWAVRSSSGSSTVKDTSIYFWACYDFAGADFHSIPLEVSLYRDKDSVPTSTAISLTGLMDSEQEGVDGEFYVGTEELTGGDETTQDAVANGDFTFQSILRDQYGLEIAGRNTLEFVPTEETAAALTAANRDPAGLFTVESGNSNWYTIKYESGRNANDTVEGVYILRASYEENGADVKETEKRIYLHKPDDRLNYIKTTVVNSSDFAVSAGDPVDVDDGEGQTVNVACQIPYRKSGETASSVSNAISIRIDELANQWRVPGGFAYSISAYDIVSGLRDSNGNIDLAELMKREDIEVYFETTQPVSGVTLNHQTGVVTYNNTVEDNSEFIFRLVAKYKDDTRYLEYHLQFSKDAFDINDINIRPSEGSIVKITVPENGNSTSQTITTVPVNQFLEEWNWRDALEAYEAGGRLNMSGSDTYNWELYPVEAKDYNGVTKYVPTDKLPEGVTMSGENNNVIVVSSSAKDSTFQVKALFGRVDANGRVVKEIDENGNIKNGVVSSTVMTVQIVRPAEKVSNLQKLEYQDSKNELYSPEVTEGSSDLVVKPTFVVINQYGEEMAPKSDGAAGGYEAVWTYSVTSTNKEVASDTQAAEYITVNKDTGVLTVEKGAPDCTVAITVKATPSDKLQTKSVTVTIKRGLLQYTDLRLTEDFYDEEDEEYQIEYPTVESEGRTTQLTVEATSNYSLDYAPVASGGLTWSLTSVTFDNGSGEDGDIYVNESVENKPEGSITFSGNTANNSVSLSPSGVLNFISVTRRKQVPRSITVTVRTTNGAEFPLTITVPDIGPYPYSLYFDPDHYKGIQLPTAGNTVEFVLTAELKDQYGLVMDQTEYPVKWSLPNGTALPQGVTATLDENGFLTEKKITVDNTVNVNANGTASLQLLATVGELSQVVNILMAKNVSNLYVDSVTDVAFRDFSGRTLELPASKTGSGYAAYVMTAVVRDQYDTPMGGAVTWSVTSTNGISVKFTDTAAGILRLNYTDAARDKGKDAEDKTCGTFTVRATSQQDTSKYCELTVTVVLAESEAVYAVPVITYPGEDPDEDSQGNPLPIVPTKNRPEDTVVTLKAVVYDQYGIEMENQPATMQLAASSQSSSLKLEQTSTAGVGGATENIATLTISIGAKDSVVIEAALPDGAGTPQPGESNKTFLLSKGPSYAYALQLAQSNSYSFALPLWQSSYLADEPAPAATKDITIRAEVIDQNGVWFESESTRTYPLWEFVGEHEGIEFADSMAIEDGSTWAKGEDLVLTVSSDAIGQEDPDNPVLFKDVTIRVTTKGHEGEEDFTIEKTLHFTRELPTAYRMYVDGVSDGEAIEPLKRPTAEEGETVYSVVPRVYDQYGVEIKGAATTVDLLTDSVEQQGIVVEAVYDGKDPAPSANEPDTRTPVAYSLYQVEQSATSGGDGEAGQDGEDADTSNKVLIGSFDRLTGEMTLYTASSTLTWLNLCASFAKLGDPYGTKQVTVYIQMDEPIPSKVAIGELERIYYMQIAENTEAMAASDEADKNTTELLWPLVYDQYGEEFEIVGDRLYISWELMVPGTDGTYTSYTEELGPDGLPRSGAELLVQKGAKRADNSVLITIQGTQFFEDKDLAVRCLVIDTGNGNKQLESISDFSVLQYRSGSSVTVTFNIDVTFDAGSYGKLVGPGTISINAGETVASLPGVKSIVGYSFIGWTSDGKTIVDPRKIPIFSSVTYYAVYKDITNTLFLEGYGSEARPNDLVTRAEFVSMVVRAMGGFDKDQNYGDSFDDVKQDQWYSNTLAYAKMTGIVKGYTDGTFRPNETISRAEAAQILYTAGGYGSTDATGSFPDVTPGSWYEDAVEALTAAGVISGFTDGTYRPANKLSRAEAAKLIVMITVNAPNELEYDNIRNYAYCPFTDVTKGHWAYVYILRAAGVA